ncbi:unnamed protein product [Peronospora belbahrii]|uniref:Minichromosome loss protein Mcl1 middle region domain-containing protein n=1 Tax=Peronospora belbahrii TaxID=622444 RepID=A0ABN8D8I6_9STRA|nr:unnamed protein product [Peronospora belbahrii]
METMKELAVNVNGKGAMQLITTLEPFKHHHHHDESVSRNQDLIITSGEDGVLFVTDLKTEKVICQSEICDGFLPSFAIPPDQTHVFIVSDEECHVASYTFLPTCELDQLVRRSTVSIRQVTCSSKFIAIADEEPVVRVLLRSNMEHMIVAKGGATTGGTIKSIVLDPDDNYLCVSSEDATVRVFELNALAESAVEVKCFNIKHGDIRHDDVLLQCAWQSGGTDTVLAVPMDKGIIELFEKNTWVSKGKLMLPIGKSIAADVDILAFSPNGQYLAAATCGKEVFVWKLETRTVLRSFKIDYPALGVQFANKSNALVVYHLGGKLAFVKDVVPAGHTPPQHIMGQSIAASTSSKISKLGTKDLKASALGDEKAEADGKHKEEDEVSFDDDDNDARVEAIKASFGFGSAANATGDDRIDDQDISASALPTVKSSHDAYSPLRTIIEPFQPGSTLDATERSSNATSLLAWTPEGEIEVIRGASMSENLVKVEFADKSRRGFKLNDNYMFSMAFLDDYGAIFAVPRRTREDWEDLAAGTDESDVISSFIFYRPFESWASNSSWHKRLPDGEDAECVAAGREFCAVTTSLHTLRIYTSSGIDYVLLRLSGRIVTMTAKETLLAVVYHGLYGEMLYQLLRIQVDSSCERVVLVSKGQLPMTPPPRNVFASHKENETMREDISNWSKLTWIGFDDRQILYAVDSFSCIQALSPSTGWNWFPIGCVGNALQKKPEDRHGVFTLGVVNDSLLYFPLENGARAPKLRGNHRPVPRAFPLRTASFPNTLKTNEDAWNGHMWQNVRLCGLEAVANNVHAGNVADQVVHEQAEMDKALILMMKTACSNDEPARVLGLAKCLHLEKSHLIAQKLAIHFSLRQLQSQLYELYRVKFEQPQRFEQESVIQASSQPRQQPAAFHPSTMEDMPKSREVEPLSRARSILSRPASTPSRDELDDKETASADETQETKALASPKAASTKESAARVERSVAPANPFLKRPGGSLASPSGSKKTGLQRLAKFTSPSPSKKQRRSTWKK